MKKILMTKLEIEMLLYAIESWRFNNNVSKDSFFTKGQHQAMDRIELILSDILNT